MIGKYKIAGLCISRIHDDSAHEITIELNKTLADIGYRLFVFHTTSDLFWDTASERGEITVFDLLDFRTVDVLIIVDEMIKNKKIIDKLIEKAEIFDKPVIMIGGSRSDAVNIGFDYESGFETVVRHVVEYHGITDLHFMAGIQGNDFSEARLNVFKRVLEEKNIPFDRETMVSYGDFWSVPTAAACERLLERDHLPKAIICANDSMAVTVCNTLSNSGVKVPDEVVVTGFDGILDINFSSPRITSCLCCYGDIAKKIAELLALPDEEFPTGANFLIAPRMIINESCGCSGGTIINVAKHLSDLHSRFYRYKEEEKSFNEIGVRILSSDNLKSAANELSSNIIYNMRCMLKKDWTDDTVDPFDRSYERGFGDTLCVFFDSDAPPPFAPHDFPAKGLFPGLEVALLTGYPIIFTALNFLDISMGYVVFNFQNYDLQNYEKIPQIVNALNNSLGAYRTMRYQKHITEQVRMLSQYDQLTGLFTRGGCTRSYNRLIDKLDRQSKPITVIMMDLDRLKYINDNFGHNEGDFAIKSTATALRSACPENAVCIRMGGDEMVAFLSSSVPVEDIKLEIEARLRSINRSSGKPYNISASIGVYRSSDISELGSFEGLIKSADEQMYEDKARKRRLAAEQRKDGE